MTLENGQKVIAFDFDGVLHDYHGWNDGKLNGPMPGMREVVEQVLAQGGVYVVHTTRNSRDVRAWLTAHGFPAPHQPNDPDEWAGVTNRKWKRIDVFVDDRAVMFHPVSLETFGVKGYVACLLDFEPHWRRGDAAHPDAS